MEFNTLTRELKEYQWALREMGKCPSLNEIEIDLLVYLALAAEESIEKFDEARQFAMIARPNVIVSIITKCTASGFPMKWPENATQDQV